MNRIDLAFKKLEAQGKKALIPYITAGDRGIETTVKLVYEMEEAGADIVELGIPYSDPLADGPVIQASSARALSKGIKIPHINDAVKTIRQKSGIPIVYLVYYNSVFKYGTQKFIQDAADAGIDGLIIPDLPLEERGETAEVLDSFGIHLIPLVAPTSKERIKKITENARGFVYCVSVAGVTGVRQDIETDIKEYMEEISKHTSLPKALGFGISGPSMAQKFKSYCDGIIVGSAYVSRVGQALSPGDAVASVKEFTEELRKVL
ncbi:tryptophan synthase alpha chain [Oxobacter pfennigii]|uniref:Tryptophan synthase alpha chain n=1 Tax=Oxobacter pfennigii TaxID=36849 RepID=A0A0P8Y9P1_9CLOT|nr:tryptophan synthase subunit alpha [Oxobacter pfennigii]KPU43599.1 tryptophan synthase alpha chain [Oxobacter pfennigii]